MLRGNWRFVLTIGLAALFAAAAGILIATDASRLQGFYEHQADQYAQAYRDTTDIHAESACTNVVAAERYKCVHEQYHDARERERQEYDLQAQLVTSAWTRAMGLAAIVAMVVGIVGVGLVYTTFHETRRTADEARRQADAFISAERGWLSVEFRGSGKQRTDAPITLRANVKLTGRSGIEVTEFVWIGLPKATYPGPDAGFERAELSRRIEFGEVDHALKVHEITLEPGTKFVGGWVAYRTKFPGERRSYFIGKIVVGSTYADDDVAYRVRLRKDGGWPEDT